jgi:NAD(P)-dependent dehydrogenase (short-subunit alcohol dehydrogenase family)
MHGRQQGVKSPPVSKARDQHADEEERGLIQRLTAGDHEAFERLFQRYFTEEVAAWIVDLANPTASWMTGQVIAIDGGLSIA